MRAYVRRNSLNEMRSRRHGLYYCLICVSKLFQREAERRECIQNGYECRNQVQMIMMADNPTIISAQIKQT